MVVLLILRTYPTFTIMHDNIAKTKRC